MWSELTKLLSDMLHLYQEILRLGIKKRAALVSVQLKELERIVHREQMLLNAVAKLDHQRGKVSRKLALQCDANRPPEKLEELLQFCEAAPAAALKSVQKELKAAIAEVEKVNALNTNLTQQALFVVDYQLNVLSGSSVGPTYAEKGQEQVSRAKRFDYQA